MRYASNEPIKTEDQQAIEKLVEKLTELEKRQEYMKEANKCVKRNDMAGYLALPSAMEAKWNVLFYGDKFGKRGGEV